MVHTIALETGEWEAEAEAEAAEVFLVLRLEDGIYNCPGDRHGIWYSQVFLYFFVTQ